MKRKRYTTFMHNMEELKIEERVLRKAVKGIEKQLAVLRGEGSAIFSMICREQNKLLTASGFVKKEPVKIKTEPNEEIVLDDDDDDMSDKDLDKESMDISLEELDLNVTGYPYEEEEEEEEEEQKETKYEVKTEP